MPSSILIKDVCGNVEQQFEFIRDSMGILTSKRILLVGGAGFIGHHLALTLQGLGAEVFIVDSLQVNNLLSLMSQSAPTKNRNWYLNMVNQRLNLLREARIPLHVQDVRDYHAISRICGEIKPDIVVHLAAVAHANRANKDPFSTFDHSLRTLENMLDFARDSVEHFIYFSSSMVYGNFKDGFVSEDTACEPLGIYGALKFAGEKMVIAYNQVFKLPYTIIRPSALYGERCVSGRVGQVFIENALKGIEITVNGDGSDRLDFTYISDLVDGVIRVITNKNSRNQIFNLTYGSSRSTSDMANILQSHFPDISVRYLPKDELMPSRGTLSIDKAKSLLGYNPQFPLEEGFVQYINWYKDSFAEVADFNILEIDESAPRKPLSPLQHSLAKGSIRGENAS